MIDQASRDAARSCGRTARGTNPAFAAIAALASAFIVYGSLYPFHFRSPAGGGDPMSAFLGSWSRPPGGRGDLVANLLLYMPFGFSLVLAAGGRSRQLLPLLIGATAAGAALSAALEIAQFYLDGRVTALSDWYLNTAGALVGAASARIVAPGRIGWRIEMRRRQAFPMVMLASWAGSRLYPYVPTIDLHKYWDSLKPILLYPNLAPLATFRHVTTGLAVAHLLEAVLGAQYARGLAPLVLIGYFGAKILIIDQTLALPEVVGTCAAMAAWILLQEVVSWRSRALLIAGLLLVAIVIERLEPFQFSAVAKDFGWVPFAGLVQGSLEINAQSFMRKSFLYGSVIWLAVEGGVGAAWIAAFESVMLLATSLAEIYIPGRSAEITDAMMAVLIAAVCGLAGAFPGKPDPRRMTQRQI